METNVIPETPRNVDRRSCSDNDGLKLSTSLSNVSTDPDVRTCRRVIDSQSTGTISLPVTSYDDPECTPILRFANIAAAAGLTDPFAILVSTERFGTATITHAQLSTSNQARIHQKLSDGAILVEAGNWAAMACWEPPAATVNLERSDGDLSFPELEHRPIMQDSFRQWAVQRRKVVSGRDYWHLSLMARDPARRDVKGAVRAVLEIGIKWAEEDGKPIWLEAGNQRAREIYAAFGFKEVGVTWHGGGKGRGIPIWVMIRDPPA